jgi:hypothetical protein
LKDEIGSQGVVSEILNGKRQLNTRQVRALNQWFGVSPAVFIWLILFVGFITITAGEINVLGLSLAWKNPPFQKSE